MAGGSGKTEPELNPQMYLFRYRKLQCSQFFAQPKMETKRKCAMRLRIRLR